MGRSRSGSKAITPAGEPASRTCRSGVPTTHRPSSVGPVHLPADGRWVVGTPDRHVLLAGSPAGVIVLLPLLERPMTAVAADLGVSRLTQHSLAFERGVDAALDERSSGRWTAYAIAWLD